MGRNFTRNELDAINMGEILTARFERDVAWSFLTFFRIENTAADDNMLISKLGNGNTVSILVKVDGQAAPGNFEIFLGGTWATEEITGGNVIALNTWYLVCVTCKGDSSSNDCTLYTLDMDGVYLDDALTGTMSAALGDTSDVYLGLTRFQTEDAVDGDMAHASYVDAALTKREIEGYLRSPARMIAEWVPKYGVQWYVPLGIGSPEPDFSGSGNNGIVVGTPGIGENPPTAPWYGFDAGWAGIVAPVAGGTTIPVLMGSYKRRRV